MNDMWRGDVYRIASNLVQLPIQCGFFWAIFLIFICSVLISLDNKRLLLKIPTHPYMLIFIIIVGRVCILNGFLNLEIHKILINNSKIAKMITFYGTVPILLREYNSCPLWDGLWLVNVIMNLISGELRIVEAWEKRE